MSRVSVEREGAVAHVRMTRGDKRNGLDLDMFEALSEAGRTLCNDTTLRAVTLSGEGPAFCAGLDWKSFMSTSRRNRVTPFGVVPVRSTLTTGGTS